MARDTKTTQSNASMQTNPPMIAFKEISPSSRHRTEDISQRVSHGDSISRNNISSIGSAQQSDSVHGNNKYVDQNTNWIESIQEIRRETHPAV